MFSEFTLKGGTWITEKNLPLQGEALDILNNRFPFQQNLLKECGDGSHDIKRSQS